MDRPAATASVADGVRDQAAAENFPVALRLLPRRYRGHLLRFYDYARFVDDMGDEAAGDRRAGLGEIAADIAALYAGRVVTLPIVAALGPTVREKAIPAEPFLKLVSANLLDQDKSAYTDYADLVAYCTLSADPVGRVVLYVFGAVTTDNLRDSDAVCTALQVLEHCQDVAEDFGLGRVYLPADDLVVAGVERVQLARSQSTPPAVRRVVATQVGRAEAALLASGPPLVRRLRGWARVAVAGYVAGGLATVDALRSADYDVLAHDVKPSKGQTAKHAARLVLPR
jgi:squalene synthase HpnC